MNETKRMLPIAYAVMIAALVFLVSPPAFATYGGSGGYQSENRENQSSCPYQNDCYGRCGPGCSTYFGTVSTQACANHDGCIKSYVCAGYSNASAHLNCLTGTNSLGKAAASLISYHWNNAVSYVKSNIIGTWARVGS